MRTSRWRCGTCQATWSQRGARWCAGCGAARNAHGPDATRPTRPAREGRDLRATHPAAVLGGVVTVLGLAGLLAVTLSPGLAARAGTDRGAVTVGDELRVLLGSSNSATVILPERGPLTDDVSDPGTSSGASGAAEPGSTGLSLADPPPDAPWLTEDGRPWQGDLTLDPDPPTGPPPDLAPLTLTPLGRGAWRLQLTDTPVAATSAAGVLLIATADDAVHAIGADDGAHRWTSWVEREITALHAAAATDPGDVEVVLVRHASGRITALDPEDGRVRWRHLPPAADRGITALGSREGTVLLTTGARPPELLALHAHDGRPRWRQPDPGDWLTDDHGEVVGPAGVLGRALHGVALTDGHSRWQVPLRYDERPVTAVAGRALLRGPDGYRWVDLDTGEIRPGGSGLHGSWLGLPDAGVVVTSGAGPPSIRTLNPDGEARWWRSLPGPEGVDCCVGLSYAAPDRILVADRRGATNVLLLDSRDGTEVADLSYLERAGDRRVLAVRGEVVLVGTRTGTQALQRRSGEVLWQVPEGLQVLRTQPLVLVTGTASSNGDREGDGGSAAPAVVVLP